jgi:hypothetical protein
MSIMSKNLLRLINCVPKEPSEEDFQDFGNES